MADNMDVSYKRVVTNPKTARPVPAACQNEEETGDIEL